MPKADPLPKTGGERMGHLTDVANIYNQCQFEVSQHRWQD